MLASNGTTDGGDENLTDFEDEDDFRENHRSRRRSGTASNLDDQSPKHWLWGNWILLGILACLSFSSCNVFIGELSQMGLSSTHYFCTGSLVFSIAYFAY